MFLMVEQMHEESPARRQSFSVMQMCKNVGSKMLHALSRSEQKTISPKETTPLQGHFDPDLAARRAASFFDTGSMPPVQTSAANAEQQIHIERALKFINNMSAAKNGGKPFRPIR